MLDFMRTWLLRNIGARSTAMPTLTSSSSRHSLWPPECVTRTSTTVGTRSSVLCPACPDVESLLKNKSEVPCERGLKMSAVTPENRQLLLHAQVPHGIRH